MIALTSKQKGSKRSWLVPLLSLCLLLLLFLLPIWPSLTITKKAGALLLALPIRREEQFSIRYIHSVNRSPVIDTIEWQGGTALVVRTSLFQTYGAGIPGDADGVGTHFSITEQGMLLSGIDAPHEIITLFTGTIADHYILYRGKEIQLKAIAGEKQPILLQARRVSLLTRMTHPAPE